MFRALLAHPQDAFPHTALGTLLATIAVSLQSWASLQSWYSRLTLYARSIPSVVCGAPPEDEQVMLTTCRGP
jgi:hypothetical protein